MGSSSADNVQGKSGIYGVLNMSIETSKNAYFYMKPWLLLVGQDIILLQLKCQMELTNLSVSVANPEGLLVDYPTPGDLE